jgi:tetratricopeptide (TPR) repeat protein
MAKAQLSAYIDAVKDFNKAIDANPTHLKAYYNRALAKGRLDDFKSAILDLNKVIELDKNYVNAYYSRAFWNDLSGNYEAAIADYKKVIELDPSYKEAYIGMATAMYAHGDKANACETLSIAENKGSVMAEEIKNKICE